MSGREHLGVRDEADEVYPPGERYQADGSIDGRTVLIAIGVATAIHYLPGWGSGLLAAALGLYFILREVASKAFRRGDIVAGAALILLGGVLASGLTKAGQ